MNTITLQAIRLNTGHIRVLSSSGTEHKRVRAYEVHFATRVVVREGEEAKEVELQQNIEIKAELLVAKHIIKTELCDYIGGENIRLRVSHSEAVRKLQIENSELVDCIPFAHFLSTRQIGTEIEERDLDMTHLWVDHENVQKIPADAAYETVETKFGEVQLGRHAIVRLRDRLGQKTLADAARRMYRALQSKGLVEGDFSPGFVRNSEAKHGYVPMGIGMTQSREVEGKQVMVKVIFLIDNHRRPGKLITTLVADLHDNADIRLQSRK